MIYSASWMLTMQGPPIENGQIFVRNGLIEDAGQGLEKKFPSERVFHFQDCVLMPGFVNAHSHLDYTALRGQLDSLSYHEWINTLKDFALSSSDEQFNQSAKIGIEEMIKSGITCIADSGPYGNSLKAVAEYGLRAVVYLETFGGWDVSDLNNRLSKLLERFQLLKKNAPPIVRIGISPHSVYNSSKELISTSYNIAATENAPFMIHLSEIENSAECCESKSQAEYLDELGVISNRTLLAHCTYCSSADIVLINRAGASIVHCPRSNSILGYGIVNSSLLKSNLVTGIGTDSAASNFDLSLINEARFALALHRAKNCNASILKAEDVLFLATRGGAIAIGYENVGCLAPNWVADFIVIKIPYQQHALVTNPSAAVIFGGPIEVLLSVVNGKVIYQNGQFTCKHKEL